MVLQFLIGLLLFHSALWFQGRVVLKWPLQPYLSSPSTVIFGVWFKVSLTSVMLSYKRQICVSFVLFLFFFPEWKQVYLGRYTLRDGIWALSEGENGLYFFLKVFFFYYKNVQIFTEVDAVVFWALVSKLFCFNNNQLTANLLFCLYSLLPSLS